jgi:mono/diheme cytochrome c family protein
LLQSDGMIYINTKDGGDVKLNKPIGISIPAGYTENMQLYKGEKKEDGSVNWINPLTLNKVLDTPKAGKTLFMDLCAACHAINKDIVGPALAGVEKRVPDKKLLYAIIRNSNEVLKSGNPYFTKVWLKYNKIAKNVFPDLSDEGIEAILAYIRSVEGEVVSYDPGDGVRDTLPRNLDTSAFGMWDTYEGDTTMQSWTDTMHHDSVDVAGYEAGLRGGFTDQLWSDQKYMFEINTLGWYNIDMAVQGIPGTTLCDVKATAKAPAEIDQSTVNVYLFIPSRKNLSVGMRHPDDRFYFEKWQGKIPLFTDDKAFLLAFGNKDDDFYYGITGFTVTTEQEINISLQKTTKENFLKQVKALKFEGIQFDVKKQ